jgi:hypothetical protein
MRSADGADSLSVGQIPKYLADNSAIPLAGGVGQELAGNLLDAQALAWGKRPAGWLAGSLGASEAGVLEAISLYFVAGGPTLVTDQQDKN